VAVGGEFHFDFGAPPAFVEVVFSANSFEADLCKRAFYIEENELRLDLVADESGVDLLDPDRGELPFVVEPLQLDDRSVGRDEVVMMRGQVAF